jgi:hypothetical protein
MGWCLVVMVTGTADREEPVARAFFQAITSPSTSANETAQDLTAKILMNYSHWIAFIVPDAGSANKISMNRSRQIAFVILNATRVSCTLRRAFPCSFSSSEFSPLCRDLGVCALYF